MTTAQASTATTEIEARLDRLAAKRREITRLLNEVGEQVRELEVACGKECSALISLVRIDRSGARAKEIAEGIAARRIDTGSMNSWLVEVLQDRGHAVYPPPFPVEKPNWALVADC